MISRGKGAARLLSHADLSPRVPHCPQLPSALTPPAGFPPHSLGVPQLHFQLSRHLLRTCTRPACHETMGCSEGRNQSLLSFRSLLGIPLGHHHCGSSRAKQVVVVCTHTRAQRRTPAPGTPERTSRVLSQSLQCSPLRAVSPDTIHYGNQTTASTIIILPQPRHCALLLFSLFPLQIGSEQQLRRGATELTYVKVWMSRPFACLLAVFTSVLLSESRT